MSKKAVAFDRVIIEELRDKIGLDVVRNPEDVAEVTAALEAHFEPGITTDPEIADHGLLEYAQTILRACNEPGVCVTVEFDDVTFQHLLEEIQDCETRDWAALPAHEVSADDLKARKSLRKVTAQLESLV